MRLTEEIRQIKESKKDLKKFGLTVGAVLLVVAILLVVKGGHAWTLWAATGVVLVALAFAAPSALKPLNRIWMIISILLGWVMARVILAILFYVVLTPTALLARLFRKDVLDRKMDGTAKSYWQKREPRSADRQSYERQF